jgi:hypothetical protein
LSKGAGKRLPLSGTVRQGAPRLVPLIRPPRLLLQPLCHPSGSFAMAVGRSRKSPNETVEHPVGQSRLPFLGFDRPSYAPRAVENQLPTRAGLLMRFGSSQHLKMADLVDSKAEVETDPIRKKRLQGLAVAFRMVAARAAKRVPYGRRLQPQLGPNRQARIGDIPAAIRSRSAQTYGQMTSGYPIWKRGSHARCAANVAPTSAPTSTGTSRSSGSA